MSRLTYKDAGVDIEKGAEFADAIYELMRKTFTERVLENRGGFAALFSLDYDERIFRRNYRHPILVSSTDGVGTKLKVACMAGRHDTIGIDLVAMCVNDVLVQGAEPLFFLDCLSTSSIEPEHLQAVIKGISEGCRCCDCALLGGETAEMPGLYRPGEYELVGFVVGIVDERRLITGARIRPGDVVIGLPSSGLHSNGYSLVRKVLLEDAGMGLDDSLSEYGIERKLQEELLEPTRIYVRALRGVLRTYRIKQVIHGMAHITGGGLPGNVPRILPPGCAVEIDSSMWVRPRVFDVVQQLGGVETEEMYRVFNMGIGLVVVAARYYAQSVLRKLRRAGENASIIGRVVQGDRTVRIT